MRLRRLDRVVTPTWVARLRLPLSAAIALTTLLGAGCNLVLDNEKRTLAARRVDAHRADASTDDAAASGPDASSDASLSERDGGSRDASAPAPAICASTGGPAACTPGTPARETQACGRCLSGLQERQRTCTTDCTWTPFEAWSDCLEPADTCAAGEMQQRAMPCGPCGGGTRIDTRSCTSTCGWSDWSEGSCTLGPNRCIPQTTEMLPPMRCDTRCGMATPTRTCNAQCYWEPAVAGACVGQGVCVAGETQMSEVGCNASFCNKGRQQQMQTCTPSCSWGSAVALGACTIPRNVCRPTDLGGVGYRCRQDSPGFREGCNLTSAREAVRCTWNGAREASASCE